jgi:glycosyltransferase involved in cell wall biosynthesis
MRKQRVAFVLPNFGGGGAERVQLVLIKALIAAGHGVDLLLAHRRGELIPLLPSGVRVVDLEAARLASALPALAAYLRHERPDTLVAVMWPMTIITSAAHLAVRSRARLVLADHAILSRQYATGLQRQLLRWTVRLFYPRADVRIVCSEGSADDLTALSGISRSLFTLLRNPLELPNPLPPAASAERWWNGASDRVIAVGNLHPVKNHALLIEAFAAVAAERPQAKLLVLGEGPLRPALEAQIEELGLRGRITLAGFQLDPWPFLASADLFVMSSSHEASPLVLVEALHAGLRIVSTDCQSGPAELLDDGHYGMLTPVGDPAALTRAMVEALALPSDDERQRRRAQDVGGRGVLYQYLRALLTP